VVDSKKIERGCKWNSTFTDIHSLDYRWENEGIIRAFGSIL
jgi:hypothetical protein